jgi:hypothetical protein
MYVLGSLWSDEDGIVMSWCDVTDAGLWVARARLL